jgi:hypothetical protein
LSVKEMSVGRVDSRSLWVEFSCEQRHLGIVVSRQSHIQEGVTALNMDYCAGCNVKL